jgi:hypothetical protein
VEIETCWYASTTLIISSSVKQFMKLDKFAHVEIITCIIIYDISCCEVFV